ncbi:MAG TPA: phage tail tube protein [Dermatophilaceae bacterium]|nr:phage tail tube protein [Dermatophilaceae bacterium]
MTTPQDCSVGLGVESVYGTAVARTRWFEFLDESFNFVKNVKQGVGLRVGSRVARSGRRVVASAEGSGDLTIEAVTKGLGLLWQLGLGSGTSTLVSAGLYQQVFTLGDVMPSATIQKGIPRADGTVDAYTFTGCMVESLTIDCPNADNVKVKTSWNAKDMTTATAYTAPSYATGPSVFTFAHGAVYSGALTAPTATALGSAATPVASIRSGSITIKHNLKTDRYNCGGGGRKEKPFAGIREISGSLVAEYADAAFRDAIVNDTSMTLVKTFTAGADVLQIVIPDVRFDGDIVKASTDLAIQDIKWTGLDGLTAAQPIWIVCRTADTAL